LLELEQIQEMAGEGVEFGSHGMGYRSLPGLDDSALMRDLSLSREVIEAVTGKPVRAFSYPYSHVDARAKKAVRATGYQCAFAVNEGPLLATRNPRPMEDPPCECHRKSALSDIRRKAQRIGKTLPLSLVLHSQVSVSRHEFQSYSGA